MFEELGPNMARAIVGEDYNPDYKYELETSDEGLCLHITDRSTGDSHSMMLKDDPKDSKHYDPMYDEERIDAIKQGSKRSYEGFLLALSVSALLLGILMLGVLILVRHP